MTSPAVLLPLDIDLIALTDAVHALDPDLWVPHFNTTYYTGDWSGLALRSVNGESGRLYPDPTASGHYADTELLTELPAFVATLELFRCELLAVRLLRLGPNSHIREHTDLDLSIEDGEARIHVCLVSDHSVTFCLDNAQVPMKPGEAWYLDLNLPHSVENNGLAPRIHLVVDCVVNDWLRQLIEQHAR